MTDADRLEPEDADQARAMVVAAGGPQRRAKTSEVGVGAGMTSMSGRYCSRKSSMLR